jgi:hypothetical protein
MKHPGSCEVYHNNKLNKYQHVAINVRPIGYNNPIPTTKGYK